MLVPRWGLETVDFVWLKFDHVASSPLLCLLIRKRFTDILYLLVDKNVLGSALCSNARDIRTHYKKWTSLKYCWSVRNIVILLSPFRRIFMETSNSRYITRNHTVYLWGRELGKCVTLSKKISVFIVIIPWTVRISCSLKLDFVWSTKCPTYISLVASFCDEKEPVEL